MKRATALGMPVQWMIRTVIAAAHESGAKVGLCGQAPSDHPEFGPFLVKCGIDSISVSPDLGQLPVVQHNEPLGLLRREDILTWLSLHGAPELARSRASSHAAGR